MSTHTKENHDNSTSKYIVGFIISVVLTIASFAPIMAGWLSDWSLSAKVFYLLGLAFIQMAVQIAYFLHLNEGPDAKWNIVSLWVTVAGVFIIIFGSWWTMYHLNYNMQAGTGRVVNTKQIYHGTNTEPVNTAPSVEGEENVAPSETTPSTQGEPTVAPQTETPTQ